MELPESFRPILKQYPQYVSKEQMCKICHISKKTAYNVLHSGKVPYTPAVDHLTHFYKIAVLDILNYLCERNCLQDAHSEYITSMKQFYEYRLSEYPDALRPKHVEQITGFGHSAVAKWLFNKHLKAFLIDARYQIPKVCLIDFLVSPYYRLIRVKSRKQRRDMVTFENWYKAYSNQ